MKKYLNIAFGYAITALVVGVFYREFTKWNDFSGVTTLGKLHVHMFVLGVLMFLIVALFVKDSNLENQKLFKPFMLTYNIGLPVMVVMMAIRGITQVLDITISTGLNGAISGISGIGHILVGAGIILFLISLKKEFGNK